MVSIRSLPSQDLVTRLLYKPASWIFSRPDWIEERFVKTSPTMKGTGKEALMKFAAKLVNWDKWGFQKGMASAPLGAACYLFFIVMMGAREFFAWQRGKANGNDFRENKDILFRDTIAISLFVFGLDMITRAFNRQCQKLAATGGLKLFETSGHEVLPYSRFANYRIDSEKALLAIIREGGGDGLKRAYAKLQRSGLAEQGGEKVKARLEAILKALPDLVDKVNAAKGAPEAEAALLADVRKLFEHIQAGDEVLDKLLQRAKDTGFAKSIKAAEKVQNTFKDAVVRYAQRRRLPSDILGFILVVLMLGWFPGWFNAWRNRKEFEKDNQSSGGDAAPVAGFNARQTWQAFQSQSRLARNFRSHQLPPHNLFAAGGFNPAEAAPFQGNPFAG